MKIALLGDTHWGARNDLAVFYIHMEKFFDFFIDYLIENDIKHVFQLGDLYDRRKYINIKTLQESQRILFDRLAEYDIVFHTLVGNHDTFYKESLETNTLNLVLGKYDNVIIHDKPSTVILDDYSFDIVPWICKENQNQILEYIDNSDSHAIMGHFEISGFLMHQGMEHLMHHMQDILPVSFFEKYQHVFSGHYHTRSQKDNILYIGTPYELTWHDYNDPKGFHIFDTKNQELTFVKNPNTHFVRLEYNDSNGKIPSINDLSNCFVKLFVTNKSDMQRFDNFMITVYNNNPYDLKVIEDLNLVPLDMPKIGFKLENTIDVVMHYIDSLNDTSISKTKLKNYFKELYIEAMNVSE